MSSLTAISVFAISLSPCSVSVFTECAVLDGLDEVPVAGIVPHGARAVRHEFPALRGDDHRARAGVDLLLYGVRAIHLDDRPRLAHRSASGNPWLISSKTIPAIPGATRSTTGATNGLSTISLVPNSRYEAYGAFVPGPPTEIVTRICSTDPIITLRFRVPVRVCGGM